MEGYIKECQGTPEPNCYTIAGEDGNEYHAHIGDLKKNEEIIEKHNGINIEILNEGDKVEFDIFDSTTKKKAMHVRKAN